MIVENTFTSIPHMAQLMIPAASSFPKLCFKNKVCTTSIVTLMVRAVQFLSFHHIRRVRAPTLFLSGVADQLIPPTMMMELYQVICSSTRQQQHVSHCCCCRRVEQLSSTLRLSMVAHTMELGLVSGIMSKSTSLLHT